MNSPHLSSPKMGEGLIIETKYLWKTYKLGNVDVNALRGVNLTIGKGDFTAIMGPSGSGKSSLLHIMGLMDSPSKGDVYYKGLPISKMKERERSLNRLQNFGFIFQTFNLLSNLNALLNVEIAMRLAGVPKNVRKKRAHELLEKVGLEDRAKHLPNQLSGGQRQRVAIARALANTPEIILADEPTGNLDSSTGKEIVELLSQLNKEGQTIIMVTHNNELVKSANKVFRITDGCISCERN